MLPVLTEYHENIRKFVFVMGTFWWGGRWYLGKLLKVDYLYTENETLKR